MTNDDTNQPNDAEGVLHLDTDRRRFLQAAGVGATGIAALGGYTAAQSSDDNHIELEAVTVELGGGRGRSEYAWEDGEEGVVRGPPEAVCDAQGGQQLWMGVSPGTIADVTNPTLELTEGETYTVEWTNTDGETHNFVIVDDDGDEFVSSDDLGTEGESQTVEFEATEAMAEYHCGTHPSSQRGNIEVSVPGEAAFEVSAMDPTEMTVTQGDTASFSVTVTNTGDASGTGTVTMTMDGEEMASHEETLDAGASTTTTMEMDTTGMSAGDHTVTVSTDGSQVSATMTVEATDVGDVNLMILSATDGFRHGNIEYGIQRMQEESDRIASRVGADSVTIDAIPEDASQFPTSASELEQYDAIIWFNTTSNVLSNPDQRAAFEEYIQNGGGYVGIHAAGDTHHPGAGEWDFYLDMLGNAYFNGHPPGTYEAEIHVTDRSHPSTEHLPARWTGTDEWYGYSANPRGDVHVLAELSELSYVTEHNQANPDDQIQSYMNHEGFGRDHPISWCQHFQGGRAWYTGRGHSEEAFDKDGFLDHIVGGISWAGGFEDDPSNGTIWDSYEREVLVDGLSEPMKMDVAEDGRVFFTERTSGNLTILDPDTGETTTAMTLDVYSGQEDGMQGVTLDPDFADNGYLYLYYSPADEDLDPDDDMPYNLLSRFTVDGDEIDPDSETEILRVHTQRETCCHTGGDLEFDTQGNLYITTGDDTNPFESDAYTPIDEREGREPYDAQRTSGNTNDLRGSVLKITPQDDGSYTIPDDNLFVDDEYDDDLVRDEIFGMGMRNPFTAAVDLDTDELWVADYGPDSDGWDADRGPMGTTEYAKVDEPGFYGWPYFTGHSVPYKHYNFETGESGRIFDPENPTNDSDNNTGLTELPPAQGTSIMSPYNWSGYIDGIPSEWTDLVPYTSMDEVPFPNVAGGAPMVGTVYRHDPEFGDGSLTAAMDGKIFIMEYNNGWIKYVSTDDDGEVMQVDPFLPDEDWGTPFDMNVGPDGSLYYIDYGGSISRITGGGTSTTATVSVTVEDGELVPEESTTATVEIENISGTELTDLEFSLTADDDVVQVTEPSETSFDSLADGDTQSVTYDVSVSADATMDTHALDAEVTFTHEGESKSASGSAALIIPETQVEAPYGVNAGGDPPEGSSAEVPVVIDGLEFDPAGSIDAFSPITVYDENASEAPDWYGGPTIGGPTTDEIANTSNDALYQTELFGYNLGLDIPIPNGTYDVTIHEAEIYHGGNGNGGGDGTRVFDISVEGEQVVEGLDIHAEVGHDAAWTHTVEDVEVTDGLLTISTTTQTDMSKFSAIDIRFSEPLQNGLEAYYPLDSDAPTNQVTGNEASVVGEPTSGVPGFLNDAWEFGTNGTIDTVDSTVVSEPLPINGEAVTVGAWINHEALTEDYGRVYHVDEGGSTDSPTNGWNIEFGGTDNTITQQYWDGGSIAANTQPSLPCPQGEWLFVVTVIDGDEATIYVYDEEGQLDGSPGTGDGTRGQSDMASLLLMAGDGRDTPGRMDEAWAYSRALSDAEVDRLWNQSFQGLDGTTLSLGLGTDELGVGDSTTATADFSHGGDTELGDLEFSASSSSDQLEVTTSEQTDFDSLAGGEDLTVEWAVTATDGISSGEYTVDAAVSYVEDGTEKQRQASATVKVAAPVSIPYGLDSGGEDHEQTVTIDGLTFDKLPNPSVNQTGEHNVSTAIGTGTDYEIEGTEDDALYLTEHFGVDIGYDISIPNGTYDVTLHFAEIWFGVEGRGGTDTGAGERVFDVSIQGNQVLSEYDIYEEVGALTATTETFEGIEVTDGTLSVGSTTISDDNTKFSGIEIQPSDGGGGISENLVGHVPLDGDSPTNTVTGNGVTLEGGVTTGQSGVVGDAVEVHTNGTIDSSGDGVISEPLPLNGEGATVGAWMNVSDFEEFGRAPFQVGGDPGSTPTDGWDVEFNGTSDEITAQLWNDGDTGLGSGGSSIAVDSGTWYFVVAVVEGGELRLHVFDEGGELDASPQTWTDGSRTQSDAEPIVLGAGDGRDMEGLIDDVWAYSRALSETEVGQLHAESLDGADDGDEAGLDPSTTIEVDGFTGGWEITAPDGISGETNPTLTLREGEEYTVEWTNEDGSNHDFVLWDDDEEELAGTDTTSEEGATLTLTFTATTEMVTYVCTVHPNTMVGDVEIV